MFGGGYREHTISSLDGQGGLKGAAKNRLRITLKDQSGKNMTFLVRTLLSLCLS